MFRGSIRVLAVVAAVAIPPVLLVALLVALGERDGEAISDFTSAIAGLPPVLRGPLSKIFAVAVCLTRRLAPGAVGSQTHLRTVSPGHQLNSGETGRCGRARPRPGRTRSVALPRAAQSQDTADGGADVTRALATVAA